MSGADKWMPFYVGDYLADTPHLTQAQHGAYLLLLMAMWRRDGRLPDDDKELAAITRSSPQEWRSLRPVLARFCTIASGIWTQKRLTIEIEKAGRRYKSKVENGEKGGRGRRGGPKVGTPTGERPPSDRLATGSVSLGRPLSEGGVQPQPQPQVEPLSVIPGGRLGLGGRRGRP